MSGFTGGPQRDSGQAVPPTPDPGSNGQGVTVQEGAATPDHVTPDPVSSRASEPNGGQAESAPKRTGFTDADRALIPPLSERAEVKNPHDGTFASLRDWQELERQWLASPARTYPEFTKEVYPDDELARRRLGKALTMQSGNRVKKGGLSWAERKEVLRTRAHEIGEELFQARITTDVQAVKTRHLDFHRAVLTYLARMIRWADQRAQGVPVPPNTPQPEFPLSIGDCRSMVATLRELQEGSLQALDELPYRVQGEGKGTSVRIGLKSGEVEFACELNDAGLPTVQQAKRLTRPEDYPEWTRTAPALPEGGDGT